LGFGPAGWLLGGSEMNVVRKQGGYALLSDEKRDAVRELTEKLAKQREQIETAMELAHDLEELELMLAIAVIDW